MQFIDQSIAADYYYWDFGDGFFDINKQPIHRYENPGNYRVKLYSKNQNGCESITEKDITIAENQTFFLPNAFSPNQDGVNDFWGLTSFNFNPISFKIEVYNRWGEIIYSSSNSDFLWNGYDKDNNIISNGVYTYIMEYQELENRFVQKGILVLVK